MRRASRTVTARIHRLSGQLTAVEAMIGKRRTCAEVLQQISAIRAGLDHVATIVFQTELQKLSAKKKLTVADVQNLSHNFSKTT